MDDGTMPTSCELHVRARNISIHVAYGSALPPNPSTTIHGRPIPPGYTSVTVEQIVENNEDLELDFVGGDGEKTLGDALHGVVLWRKADIKLTASTTARMQTDRPSPSLPSPQLAPSPPSPPAQRATSTPTPPAPEKGKKKTASLPAAGPSKKKQKMVERKLTYEKTAEELEEDTARYIKEQLKLKVPPPREKAPLELGKKLLARLDNPPQSKSLPSDYERTLTKAYKVRNVKKKYGNPFLSLAHNKKNSSPSGCQVCHSYTRRTYNSRRTYSPRYFFLKLD